MLLEFLKLKQFVFIDVWWLSVGSNPRALFQLEISALLLTLEMLSMSLSTFDALDGAFSMASSQLSQLLYVLLTKANSSISAGWKYCDWILFTWGYLSSHWFIRFHCINYVPDYFSNFSEYFTHSYSYFWLKSSFLFHLIQNRQIRPSSITCRSAVLHGG